MNVLQPRRTPWTSACGNYQGYILGHGRKAQLVLDRTSAHRLLKENLNRVRS